MAFSFTRNVEVNSGTLKIVSGTYSNSGGSTGGDIDTGLNYVYSLVMQPKGSSVLANQPVVNETLPAAVKVTVVNTANEVGTWIAVGI